MVRKITVVDISYLSRYYSPVEWHKLFHSTRITLPRNRKKITDKNKRKSISNNSNTMAAITADDTQSERLDTIIKFVKVLQHMPPPRGRAVLVYLPSNRSNSDSTNNVSGISASVQSTFFDHNGDPVWKLCGCVMREMVRHIASSYVSNLNHFQSYTVISK